MVRDGDPQAGQMRLLHDMMRDFLRGERWVSLSMIGLTMRHLRLQPQEATVVLAQARVDAITRDRPRSAEEQSRDDTLAQLVAGTS
jgi:hypothetical protein